MSCPMLHTDGVECPTCENGYVSDGEVLDNIAKILESATRDDFDRDLISQILEELEKIGLEIKFKPNDLSQKLGEHMAVSVQLHMEEYPDMRRAKSWQDLSEFTDTNEYALWALWRYDLNYAAELNETINEAVSVADRLLFGGVS